MITMRAVTLRRGANVVLQGAGFTLNPGEKAGLVGHNGAGKSSLFALLAGRLHADQGDVDIPPRWRIGEVAQNMPETEDGATDFVLQGDLPLQAAQAALAAAEASGDGHAMADAHLALDEAGAFDARSRARAKTASIHAIAAALRAAVSSGWGSGSRSTPRAWTVAKRTPFRSHITFSTKAEWVARRPCDSTRIGWPPVVRSGSEKKSLRRNARRSTGSVPRQSR